MDSRRHTDKSQGWMGGGQGRNTAWEETWCRKGKFMEEDTDGMGEGERRRVGTGTRRMPGQKASRRLADWTGGDCHWNSPEQPTQEASARAVRSGVWSEELDSEKH